MDIVAILTDATAVVNLAKLAVDAGKDAAPFIESLYQTLVQGQPLTDEQRAALQTQEDALRAALNTDSIPADKP